MSTTTRGGRRLLGDLAGNIARLQALIDDLRHIAAGQGPTAAELWAAPLADPYWLDVRPAACLAGVFHGHPDLRGPASRSSEIWFFAPDDSWVRTRSRFYRLGRPAGTRDAS